MIYWLKKTIYIIFSVAIMSVSINIFLGPHNIAAGGLTGLSIILESAFGFNRSVVVLIFNMLILVCAFIFLGKRIFFNTVIGAALLPIFMELVPKYTLVGDVMLSMIVGSVLFGISVAILYANHASTGGTSIPPLILKKYFNINPSIGLFITDSIVVILTLFVFSIDSFFYAVFSIFITSVTMNYIETGLNRKKTVFIISNEKEAILHELLHTLDMGVTVIPVSGGYTEENMEMLMVTLESRDYQQVIELVDKYDKKAFMITSTISDVHGLGFTYESGSI